MDKIGQPLRFCKSRLAEIQGARAPPACTAQGQLNTETQDRANQPLEEIMDAYRQGNVSIIAVDGVPQQAHKVKGEIVLARGEVTGHAHRIVEGRAFLYQLATGLLYLRVLSEFAKHLK